jgi:hypothetical protein
MGDGRELAEEMSDCVNSGVNSEELVDSLGSKHRYLQSEVFKQILKPTICQFARQAENGDYDARNKAAVKECREIADAMGWMY